MKKLTTISLFIFWAAVTAILTAGLVFYQGGKNNSSVLDGSNLNNPSGSSASSFPVIPNGASATPSTTLNLATVSRHNSLKDCWLIISNKIYNVTSYLADHPGGVGAISPYCGKEATTVFATKGGRGSHSSFAASLLGNYYIGDLNQIISQPQIQQNINNTNSVQPLAGGRGDDGDDEFDD